MNSDAISNESQSYIEQDSTSVHLHTYTANTGEEASIYLDDTTIAISSSDSTVSISGNGVYLYDVVTPTNSYMAANKKYVDDVESSILSNPYIVDSGGTGANNTWNYRKWSDGTLECWARFYTSSMNITSGTGQLKYAAFSISNPNYPIAFVDAYPTVQVSGNVTNGNGWAVMDNKTYSLTGIGTIYMYSPVNVSSAGVTVNVYAIGKWE